MRPTRKAGGAIFVALLALGVPRPAQAQDLDPLFAQMQRDYLFGQYQTQDKAQRREAFERVLATSQRALEADPDAARSQLWAAVAWGLYGMSHSMFASARQGVADKIRHHATRLIEIDPAYENGAGYRLLGRLHTTVPRVPWVSMWVDESRGIELLRRALETSRHDPRNLLFLAEALRDGPGGPGALAEAEDLLREVAAFVPRTSHLEEDTEAVAQARTRLEELVDAANEAP